MTTQAAAAPPANTAGEAFDKHFVEVFFATHSFGGERQLDEVGATYEGQELAEGMVSLPKARLIPDELRKPVDRARDAVRRLLRRNCLPGDVQGSYYISKTRSVELVAQLRAAIAEFDAAADDVAASYDDIRARARAQWLPLMKGGEEEFERVLGRFFPKDAATLRAHYRIEFRPVGGQARVSKYAAGTIRAWFDEANANYVRHEDEKRRTRYTEPIERLRGAVESFSAQVADGKKLSRGSFTHVEDSIALLMTCVEVLGQPELVAAAEALRARLADVKAAALAATDGKGTFTGTVKAALPTFKDLVDRAVRECERAAAPAAVEARFGRVPAFRLADPAED